MPEPIKAQSIQCAAHLFRRSSDIKDNLDEEISKWQQHDEDLNLELINQHELAAATEQSAACSFTQELERRNIK